MTSLPKQSYFTHSFAAKASGGIDQNNHPEQKSRYYFPSKLETRPVTLQQWLCRAVFVLRSKPEQTAPQHSGGFP